MPDDRDAVRANVQAWLDAQNLPAMKVEVSAEPAVAVSKLIRVLTKCEHDVIGQAFNLYHGVKGLVVEATKA